jgi:signal transduction histidine kinase
MHRAFLSNVSHEMKTPLTVISNYAQLTRVQMENGTANGDARENLLTISLEAQRLAMLTDQLLSKPMQQAGGTGKEPIDPQKLLSRAAALCEPILQKNDNRLDTGMLADCPFVLANYDMIVQVLVNLCVNANRHTRGGRVSITVYAQEDMVAFCVEDSGEGIPPDILPHVFERGVSGDGKTGLGLAICKDVAEAHNGTIAVDSVSGKGTRVTFTLPAAGMEKGVEA